jgi:hypothetical protein
MRNQSLVCSLVVIAVIGAGACAHDPLSKHDEIQVSLRYQGTTYELTQSLWITPFFHDGGRRLLLRSPPDEQVLLESPGGEPILPGAVEGVLPAGTKISVLRVSFPEEGWNRVTRPIIAPRDRPWLEFGLAGKSRCDNMPPCYVFVLPPDLKSQDAVFARVSEVLTDKPIDQEVAALPAADQHAVFTRQLGPGISPRGLELAFGPPLIRNIHGSETERLEDWTWQSEKKARVAHLKNGVVVSTEEQVLAAQ